MVTSKITQEKVFRLWYISIYLFVAFVYVRLNTVVNMESMDNYLIEFHHKLINGTFLTPIQYRLISYYLPELIHKVFHISLKLSYIILRYIWVSLSLIIFHKYLKKWFNERIAHFGTLYFGIMFFWTIRKNIENQSEPLNILLFVISLILIIDEKYYLLLITIIIGSFNKLTIIFIPAIYFLYNYKRLNFWQLVFRTFLLFLPVFIICGGLRYYFRKNPYQCDLIQLSYNLSSIYNIAKPIILFNLFWILPFIKFRSKPIFFKRVFLIVPLFVLLHFLIGIVYETRLFLPLAPILIPMGLLTIFGNKNHLINQSN
jgi:hypothetical protein